MLKPLKLGNYFRIGAIGWNDIVKKYDVFVK